MSKLKTHPKRRLQTSVRLTADEQRMLRDLAIHAGCTDPQLLRQLIREAWTARSKTYVPPTLMLHDPPLRMYSPTPTILGPIPK